jgi:ribonuclease HII
LSPEQLETKFGDLVANFFNTHFNGPIRIKNRITESLWNYDRTFFSEYLTIAGVDEAGRGPLAGPVVCCAIIMPYQTMIPGVNDSKALPPKPRQALARQILVAATDVVVAQADAQTIDKLNIRNATLTTMKTTISNLNIKPDLVLIDGRDRLNVPIKNESIIKGDGTSYAIACASIIAKVVRDKIMEQFDIQYPGYYFAQHKGYPTKLHYQRIQELGPSPIHRNSFLTKMHYENS